MKKIEVNFNDITQEVIDAITMQYPQGFVESDIISFAHLNNAMEDRIKIKVGEVLYLVKKSVIEDWEGAKYEDGYFKSLNTEDPTSDVDA